MLTETKNIRNQVYWGSFWESDSRPYVLLFSTYADIAGIESYQLVSRKHLDGRASFEVFVRNEKDRKILNNAANTGKFRALKEALLGRDLAAVIDNDWDENIKRELLFQYWFAKTSKAFITHPKTAKEEEQYVQCLGAYARMDELRKSLYPPITLKSLVAEIIADVKHS